MSYMSPSNYAASPSVSSNYVGSGGLESTIDNYMSASTAPRMEYHIQSSSVYIATRSADPAPEFISAYIHTPQAKMPEHNYANAEMSFQYSLPITYNSSTHVLLKTDRNSTPIVSNADNIMHYIKETFEKTTDNQLPENMIIRICPEKEMARHHKAFGGEWNPGILGFAVNNNPGTSYIFIKENNLDALMLTVGHEIGHVLSKRLPDPRDEEAKAFAFEMAWMKTMKKHNIADLQQQFIADIAPAKNGLHNVAFDFVLKLINKGKNAMQIFEELFRREISIRDSI